jgi:CheY-like chemotaxis protein
VETALDSVHVLVVDDDAGALEDVKRILQNRKARVTTAVSAVESLELLQREPPDVVLTDIESAHTDGYEFVRQLRALPPDEGRDVAIAAFTTLPHLEGRQQAMLAGFDMKPVEPAELVAAVGQLAWRT